MDQRGRKSLENLTVITTLPGQRPEPPDTLTAAEADLWRAVVATKPSDWFDAGSLPILADYCRACVQQDGLARAINKCETPDINLIRLFDTMAKLKATLATKMRLSQQSKYRADAAEVASRKVGPTKPWERATG